MPRVSRRAWIVLVDGARPQIEQIQTEAAVRGARIHIVCDFIHVLEYLWKAAWCFHENSDPAAEGFVARHATILLTGGPEQVIEDLREHAAGAVAAAVFAAASRTFNRVSGLQRVVRKGWPWLTRP